MSSLDLVEEICLTYIIYHQRRSKDVVTDEGKDQLHSDPFKNYQLISNSYSSMYFVKMVSTLTP